MMDKTLVERLGYVADAIKPIKAFAGMAETVHEAIATLRATTGEGEWVDDAITPTDVAGVLGEIAEQFDGGEYHVSDETRRTLIDFAHGIPEHPLFGIVGHYFAQNPVPGAAPPPPLRDAGAVAWQIRRTDFSTAPWEACTPDAYDDTLRTGRFLGFDNGPPAEARALYAHPARAQVDEAMVSDALGIPRGHAALILQVKDGDRTVNGRWLAYLPAAAAKINAALAAAKEVDRE